MKRFIVIALFGILFAHAAQAAVLIINPPNGANQIVISLDTQGQNINAVEAHLSFDPSVFSIVGISDGGSAINLWIEQPAFSNSLGTVDFSGIVPGGIDTASGTIVTLSILPTIKSGGASTEFEVASATALLNDGEGTAASLTIESNPFFLVATSSVMPSFSSDTQAPDPFTPEIASDPAIFNGQYFLSFAATDQGSGINHYEVLEVSTKGGNALSSSWQVVQSPYLLRDQTLASNIYVRAIDNAGNFRVAEVPAEHPASHSPLPWYSQEALYDAAVCLIVLLGIGVFFIFRRKKS